MPEPFCYVGIGSNMGERLANLERAAGIIRADPAVSDLRASPVFETPALVPDGAPDSWRLPFLNAALKFRWRRAPAELFALLKHIEFKMGRVPSPRWSPRVLDLDLLLFGDDTIETADLCVPHRELTKRAFVLGPLKHLAPRLVPPRSAGESILAMSRKLPEKLPIWATILNVTPDSFSDGGGLRVPDDLDARLRDAGQILDLGAESTRPGAEPIDTATEWRRLEPALELLKTRFQGQSFRPRISVDTYRAETAAKAIECGCDMLNDVSGLADPAMPELLKTARCEYVLMHSLSVPADPKLCLSAADPVAEIKTWALGKLDGLARQGIDLERVIFDPGIGFGKSGAQSWQILARIEEFFDLPVRLMIGHSRKSFLARATSSRPARERDPETLGVSIKLAEKGVDILRVHDSALHARAFESFQEAACAR